MTTNHLERLDPALIRPGRIDVAELIDDASPTQAKRLFLKFYSDQGDSIADFADMMAVLVEDMASKGKRISMAALQGHFIRHDPKSAIDTAAALFT